MKLIVALNYFFINDSHFNFKRDAFKTNAYEISAF